MKIAKRLPAEIDRYDWEAKEATIEENVLDATSTFLIMVETSLDKNKKFPINEILFQWWKIAFKETPYKTLPVSCAIIKIASKLYYKSCQEYKYLMSRSFITLYKKIQSEDFANYSETQILQTTKFLSQIIDLNINTSKGGA